MKRLALLLPLLALAAAPAHAEDPATNAPAAVFPDRSAIVRYELFRRDDGESRDIPKESGDAILYDLAEEWTTLEEIRPKPGKPGEPVGEVFPAPSDFDLYCFLGDGSSKVVEFRRAIDGKSREPQLDVLPPSFTWPRRVCKENARALLAKLDVVAPPCLQRERPRVAGETRCSVRPRPTQRKFPLSRGKVLARCFRPFRTCLRLRGIRVAGCSSR